MIKDKKGSMHPSAAKSRIGAKMLSNREKWKDYWSWSKAWEQASDIVKSACILQFTVAIVPLNGKLPDKNVFSKLKSEWNKA